MDRGLLDELIQSFVATDGDSVHHSGHPNQCLAFEVQIRQQLSRADTLQCNIFSCSIPIRTQESQ